MRLLLTLLLVFFAGGVARADTWVPPSVETYQSANGQWRLTVTPRGIEGALGYFQDKVDGVEPAGQAEGETAATARARLERREGDGWAEQWAGPLVNDVAPTSALVSDDGRHVVTFDNWHHVGIGPHVVVIYRADGSVVRSMSLEEIVPRIYAAALPRSVSSLWWSGKHRLDADGRHLVLAVREPQEDLGSWEEGDTIDIKVELETGAVIAPAGRAWERANARAAKVVAKLEAMLAAERAAFVAPLRGPRGTGEDEWRPYLYDAMGRLALEDELGFFDLQLVTDRDSERELREALARPEPWPLMAIAAPRRPGRLATLIEEATRTLKADALKGTQVYLFMAPGEAGQTADLLRGRGAEVVVVDPDVPIPQRPERLSGERSVGDGLMEALEEVD